MFYNRQEAKGIFGISPLQINIAERSESMYLENGDATLIDLFEDDQLVNKPKATLGQN